MSERGIELVVFSRRSTLQWRHGKTMQDPMTAAELAHAMIRAAVAMLMDGPSGASTGRNLLDTAYSAELSRTLHDQVATPFRGFWSAMMERHPQAGTRRRS
jgi:hypothetical protein